ncbi:SGNH/GDSL hydrolase family protein [Mucilaginibacter corticis]|uniref:SGNH/GDSL hydrolase family protein n=1 Tax=Mucilaginibacter corticis TaxID=2597670 RepID=A0A556MSJ5_9SPHI|nr:SGNH/GDSL hydrolase family protein [Mucilaginibacter corticis]TSJ42934.1 SGNH/GDSL hydrolase family protein [Mucilaginibacter corticis]
MKTCRYIITLIIIGVIISSCKKSQSVVSPKKTDTVAVQPDLLAPQVIFKNVVILGNSITLTPVSPQFGWYNTWGMAASVADSDYVHHLIVHFRKYYPKCKVTVKAFNDFEAYYPTYNFDANLKSVKDSLPDLVIVRIGENIDRSRFDKAVFQSKYQAFVNYLTAGNSKLSILSAGPLWSVPEIDDVFKAYTPYVSLSAVSTDSSNFAFGLYTDPAVQQHPGDKGMHLISDIIWDAVRKLKAK